MNTPLTIKPSVALIALVASVFVGYFADQRKAELGITTNDAHAAAIGQRVDALETTAKSTVNREDFLRFQDAIRAEQNRYVGRDEFNQFSQGLAQRLAEMSQDLRDIKAGILRPRR